MAGGSRPWWPSKADPLIGAVVLLVAAVTGLAAGAAVRLRLRFIVVDVVGISMEPTLHYGDRVLVRRAPIGPGVRERSCQSGLDFHGYWEAILDIVLLAQGISAGLAVVVQRPTEDPRDDGSPRLALPGERV